MDDNSTIKISTPVIERVPVCRSSTGFAYSY